MIPVALTIAGSDPSGGAGLQADLKTFHRFGVYGEAVVTLITVQNTRGVTRVTALDPELVTAQIQAVLEDIPPQAAKVGALGSREIVEAVAREAGRFSFPLIVDPVMISKHGARLIDEDAARALIEELIPRTFLLTPNLDEAASVERHRCAEIVGRHAKMFEQKRLYNTARALKEILGAILDEQDSRAIGSKFPRADRIPPTGAVQ